MTKLSLLIYLADVASTANGWADMVDFVDGDYDQFITMQDQREIPSRWRTMIPIAIRIRRSYRADIKMLSEKVAKAGVEPGPEYGEALKKMTEEFYSDIASKLL